MILYYLRQGIIYLSVYLSLEEMDQDKNNYYVFLFLSLPVDNNLLFQGGVPLPEQFDADVSQAARTHLSQDL